MVNLKLFSTKSKEANLQDLEKLNVNARNEAGGLAYLNSPKHQLAQLAVTGCLNQTYYANDEQQLAIIQKLANEVSPLFVAKTAIYARQSGFMKDMPVLLTSLLSISDNHLMKSIFTKTIDNGKQLRNFVQMIRSGAVGRKSLGSAPKKLVQNWLLSATEYQLLQASIGTKPSLADVVKMVHPKPTETWRAAWFAWLIGKPYDFEQLPAITKSFEKYKAFCQKENELNHVDHSENNLKNNLKNHQQNNKQNNSDYLENLDDLPRQTHLNFIINCIIEKIYKNKNKKLRI